MSLLQTLSVKSAARKYSCNDRLRRKLLYQQALQQAQLNEGDFIELGVYTGGTAILLADAVRRFAPTHKVYLLDSWQGLPQTGLEDSGVMIGAGFFDEASTEIVSNLLKRNDLLQFCQLHQGWFSETLPTLKGPFALAHVDCDLFSAVKESIEFLLPRMTKHGVIVVDDYGTDVQRRFPGVYRAVEACLKSPAGAGWRAEVLGGLFDQSARIVRRTTSRHPPVHVN